MLDIERNSYIIFRCISKWFWKHFVFEHNCIKQFLQWTKWLKKLSIFKIISPDINRKSVITIQIWFDLARLWIDFDAYINIYVIILIHYFKTWKISHKCMYKIYIYVYRKLLCTKYIYFDVHIYYKTLLRLPKHDDYKRYLEKYGNR